VNEVKVMGPTEVIFELGGPSIAGSIAGIAKLLTNIPGAQPISESPDFYTSALLDAAT
jgi:hypothetical protein